jgi:pimeloyl-ACP methyl ester carboxylesterase
MVIVKSVTGREFIGKKYLKKRKLGFMYPPNGIFIAFQSSQIHYQVWGTGAKVLFAFHGYGESASSFAFLGEALGPDQTLIAIDLPFHGQTDWKEGLSFFPHQLLTIVQAIAAGLPDSNAAGLPDSNAAGLPDSNAAGLPVSDPFRSSEPSWSLTGYSMGGRVALALFEFRPAAFERLILLAPDGLKINIWYWIATRTAPGNFLFRWTMRWPGWLFLLLRASHALRLVNPSIYKFAVHYIDDRKVRKELYTRWTVMRYFRPDRGAIAAIIQRDRVPLTLVYGRYDRIIRWESGERFLDRGITGTSRLILIDTGHQLLRPQHMAALLPLFSS